MHVGLKKDPVETRVQGQFIISCRMIRIVQVMHAIREGPNFGFHNYGGMISKLNIG